MKKLKIEKSDFPSERRTHVLFLYSTTEYGYSIKRIFKGTYAECKAEKERLENGKRNLQ